MDSTRTRQPRPSPEQPGTLRQQLASAQWPDNPATATCRVWECCGGTIKPLRPDPLAEQGDGDLDHQLRMAGYSRVDDEECFAAVRIRTALSTSTTPQVARWSFVVELCFLDDELHLIWVVDLPSLLLIMPGLESLAMRERRNTGADR